MSLSQREGKAWKEREMRESALFGCCSQMDEGEKRDCCVFSLLSLLRSIRGSSLPLPLLPLPRFLAVKNEERRGGMDEGCREDYFLGKNRLNRKG